ncbi:MAG: aminotransferase class I/II-fold pyridoxal phosphate-dependent enzyme, partial [Firmicutes bacterium]|nr:aminotransferase class I/II-fold pyridoxal phosphate-dependent enzyme [Bacillota bacterium]
GAELDFKTAPCIINALKERAENGLYGYTLSDDKYLSSITNWMKDVRKWDISKDWIVPTYGIIQALNCAIRAFTKPGDKVIIQNPTYHMYAKATLKNGREISDNTLKYCDGHYEMDFEDLEIKMADPKAKLMVLCNPHNPIMEIWERAELEKIASLAQKYDVIVFSDEIFAEHSYIGPMLSYGDVDNKNAVVLTSLGKAFNFTGVSHGNAIIPAGDVREKFITQRDIDHFGSIDPFVYASVVAAYSEEGKAWLKEFLDYSWKNGEILKEFFNKNFPSVTCSRQRGGTLVWVDLRSLGMTEDELHDFLLNEAKWQSDRGSIYGTGGECFTRIELGTPRSNLVNALERLYQASLKRGLIK